MSRKLGGLPGKFQSQLFEVRLRDGLAAATAALGGAQGHERDDPLPAERTGLCFVFHQLGALSAETHVVAGLDHGVDAIGEADEAELFVGGLFGGLQHALRDAEHVLQRSEHAVDRDA